MCLYTFFDTHKCLCLYRYACTCIYIYIYVCSCEIFSAGRGRSNNWESLLEKFSHHSTMDGRASFFGADPGKLSQDRKFGPGHAIHRVHLRTPDV